MARKKPPVDPADQLVLRRAVKVANRDKPKQGAKPVGRPLVTLPRGMARDTIPREYLAQLCDRHFTPISNLTKRNG